MSDEDFAAEKTFEVKRWKKVQISIRYTFINDNLWAET